MKKCPKCARIFDDSWEVCLRCGDALEPYEGAAGAGSMPEATGWTTELKKYYQNVFAKFDAGRPPISWNWCAAIFQLLWYIAKGMWPKAVLYGMIWWGFGTLAMLVEMPLIALFLWAAGVLYFGIAANYDYYLYKRRSELLWPRLSYKKVKILFWAAIVGIILYNAISFGAALTRAVTVLVREPGPGEARSYAGAGVRFNALPPQWHVVTDPPVPFSLSISRPALRGTTESLGVSSAPGTRFMGYIVEGWKGTAIYKGVVSLREMKPFFWEKYTSVQDAALLKKAKVMAGTEPMSFMSQLQSPWVTRIPADVQAEYPILAGRQWGCVRSTLKMDFGGVKKKMYRNVYWTLVKGKAVYVVTEAFEPYKDEVKAQTEGFLNSGSYETDMH